MVQYAFHTDINLKCVRPKSIAAVALKTPYRTKVTDHIVMFYQFSAGESNVQSIQHPFGLAISDL